MKAGYFITAKSRHMLGARIPTLNDAILVSKHDRILGTGNDSWCFQHSESTRKQCPKSAKEGRN
jgi:hypothetical protein